MSKSKLDSTYISNEVIQDTLRIFGRHEGKIKPKDIAVYKPLSASEACPNTPLLTKLCTIPTANVMNSIVAIFETKIRGVIKGWNSPMVDLKGLAPDELYAAQTIDYQTPHKLASVTITITDLEIEEWLDINVPVREDYNEKRDAAERVLYFAEAFIRNELYKLGYNARIETYNISRKQQRKVIAAYRQDILESELKYYYNSIIPDENKTDQSNTSKPVSAAQAIEDKLKRRKMGLSNIFGPYLDYLQHAVTMNYKLENPKDVVNKWFTVNDYKLRIFFKENTPDVIPFHCDDRERYYETLSKYCDKANCIQLRKPDLDYMSYFGSDFGKILLQYLHFGDLTKKNGSYKKYIFDNWDVFRIECLRHGVSVRHRRQFVRAKKESRRDGSPHNVMLSKHYIEVRLKQSFSDNLFISRLYRKYKGDDFVFVFEPMPLLNGEIKFPIAPYAKPKEAELGQGVSLKKDPVLNSVFDKPETDEGDEFLVKIDLSKVSEFDSIRETCIDIAEPGTINPLDYKTRDELEQAVRDRIGDIMPESYYDEMNDRRRQMIIDSQKKRGGGMNNDQY